MFTGIIEKIGTVCSNTPTTIGNRLIISADFENLLPGESIAVNGVCLTLLPHEGLNLAFDLSPETLKLTTLSCLTAQDEVNLERAMLANARFGGHYVSGHVDAKARVQAIASLGDYLQIELTGFDDEHRLYLMTKGSVCVDGVSLTINAVHHNSIQVMLVPHTLSHTTLGLLKIGQQVNIEFDYLTRIVAHQLQFKHEDAPCQ